MFAVLAREDWPSASEPQLEAVREGIEQVKIPVNKFSMGADRLDVVLETLKSSFGSEFLRIAPVGRFQEYRAITLREPLG